MPDGVLGVLPLDSSLGRSTLHAPVRSLSPLPCPEHCRGARDRGSALSINVSPELAQSRDDLAIHSPQGRRHQNAKRNLKKDVNPEPAVLTALLTRGDRCTKAVDPASKDSPDRVDRTNNTKHSGSTALKRGGRHRPWDDRSNRAAHTGLPKRAADIGSTALSLGI